MKLTIRKREAMWAYVFLAIPLLYFLIVRILPAFYSFYISLMNWNVLSSVKKFVFLKNYQYIFSDKVFLASLVNTVKYVLIGVPAALVLSICVALLLNSIRRANGLFRLMYFIPYITSAVAVSWVWRFMFMKSGGVVNNILAIFGIPQQPFLLSTTQAIYVVISNIVWQSMGFEIIIFLAGLKQIPVTYYEAAAIDGSSKWHTFWKITVPLLNPTIVYLVVMGTIQTLQAFTQVYNITDGGIGQVGGPLNSTMTPVVYIYQEAFSSYKMGIASAATVILFVAILVITILQLKVFTKDVDY